MIFKIIKNRKKTNKKQPKYELDSNRSVKFIVVILHYSNGYTSSFGKEAHK